MSSTLLQDPLLEAHEVPKHVAIIMDGNRRWAQAHDLMPSMGHWRGAETLQNIVRAAIKAGVKILTVYSFSKENWLRSQEEIDALMHLFQVYLEGQRDTMLQEGVRLDTIGDLSALPPAVLTALAETKAATQNCRNLDLVLAMNYGGRDDIKRAFVHMLQDAQKGLIQEDHITETLISQYLDTARWDDPDLLIRTSGEIRQSNFLLWQLSYAEFYYTDVAWPDFEEQDFLKALDAYKMRKRRFGGG